MWQQGLAHHLRPNLPIVRSLPQYDGRQWVFDSDGIVAVARTRRTCLLMHRKTHAARKRGPYGRLPFHRGRMLNYS